jgi:hypothetical protein
MRRASTKLCPRSPRPTRSAGAVARLRFKSALAARQSEGAGQQRWAAGVGGAWEPLACELALEQRLEQVAEAIVRSARTASVTTPTPASADAVRRCCRCPSSLPATCANGISRRAAVRDRVGHRRRMAGVRHRNRAADGGPLQPLVRAARGAPGQRSVEGVALATGRGRVLRIGQLTDDPQIARPLIDDLEAFGEDSTPFAMADAHAACGLYCA